MVKLPALVLAGCFLVSVPALAQLNEPLPIEVALSLRGHNGRSPINLSPDGQWVAHTAESEDTFCFRRAVATASGCRS